MALSSPQDGVMFDFWGDGHPRLFSWPRHPDDGFLARDLNGNGQIDDASELFGNATRLLSGERASNGYQALAELDANHDGVVDSQDPQFGSLLFWSDATRNGHADPGELLPIANVGLKTLSTRYIESTRTDGWGNQFRYVSLAAFTRPPFKRFTVDVFLASTIGQT